MLWLNDPVLRPNKSRYRHDDSPSTETVIKRALLVLVVMIATAMVAKVARADESTNPFSKSPTKPTAKPKQYCPVPEQFSRDEIRNPKTHALEQILITFPSTGRKAYYWPQGGLFRATNADETEQTLFLYGNPDKPTAYPTMIIRSRRSSPEKMDWRAIRDAEYDSKTFRLLHVTSFERARKTGRGDRYFFDEKLDLELLRDPETHILKYTGEYREMSNLGMIYDEGNGSIEITEPTNSKEQSCIKIGSDYVYLRNSQLREINKQAPASPKPAPVKKTELPIESSDSEAATDKPFEIRIVDSNRIETSAGTVIIEDDEQHVAESEDAGTTNDDRDSIND